MLGGSTNRKELGRYLALSQVGLEMVGPILLGVVLDYYLGWSPWGVLVGAVLGLTGGLFHLIQLTANDETPPTKQPPESG
jgi:F0F1-type ATP synthase assembly protein I